MMSNNKPICLFDSGIGGLTVLKKFINKFPNENYIYLADLARVPFGDKTKEEIKNIVDEIIQWLVQFEPKSIIMACNTSSATFSSQLEDLSSKFGVPVYGIIESCTRAIGNSSHKKVSVWATQLTANSNCYRNLIQKINSNISVEELGCPKLVPMIEGLSFTLEERNKIINEYLDRTSKDSNALVMGCTHYPLISEDLKKLRDIEIIDPADSLISELEKTLVKNSSSNPTKISLYTTAQKEKLERFFRLYIQPEKEHTVNLVTIGKVSV